MWLSATVSLPILRNGCDMTKPCGIYNRRHVEKKEVDRKQDAKRGGCSIMEVVST